MTDCQQLWIVKASLVQISFSSTFPVISKTPEARYVIHFEQEAWTVSGTAFNTSLGISSGSGDFLYLTEETAHSSFLQRKDQNLLCAPKSSAARSGYERKRADSSIHCSIPSMKLIAFIWVIRREPSFWVISFYLNPQGSLLMSSASSYQQRV